MSTYNVSGTLAGLKIKKAQEEIDTKWHGVSSDHRFASIRKSFPGEAAFGRGMEGVSKVSAERVGRGTAGRRENPRQAVDGDHQRTQPPRHINEQPQVYVLISYFC